MAASICPQCGEILAGDRTRFCTQCGCSLLGSAVETQNLASPSVAHSAAEAGPAVPKRRTTATNAFQPAPMGGPKERNGRNAPRGVVLSLNTNQFYMEGFAGVLDINLENCGPLAFDTVEMEVAGNLLNRTERWVCTLDPGRHESKKYPVKPQDRGVMMVTFRVTARQGDSVCSYRAEGYLLVFANTQKLHDIRLQADNMVNLSAGAGKQMGNLVNNNISIMVDQGKIRNANDLMREYQRLVPAFEILPLTYDPERSQAAQAEAVRKRKEAEAKLPCVGAKPPEGWHPEGNVGKDQRQPNGPGPIVAT